ncbi:MAG: AmmeMemoRadiSam system protein B [Bacteroidetes bacterium]|nr:AmmeMemoRadiSam system protein B [Bacteroidota bacterium]
MKAMKIRPPAVSGLFYPDDPTMLTLTVDRLLEKHQTPDDSGIPIGIVSPHAGYAYSGPTAAYAYTLLQRRPFRTAVIISPSHREYFNGISIYDGDAYRTPLGLINVDIHLREKLLGQNGIIKASQLGHRDEHSIEVQLPFLQRINPDAKVLPIVMGDQRSEHCQLLARALAGILTPDHVLIASSDLSHFHEQHDALERDRIIEEDIVALKPMRLLNDLSSSRAEACGGGPIAVVMSASQTLGADRGRILHRCTSGDVTGDTHRVVGYLSAAFTTTPVSSGTR